MNRVQFGPTHVLNLLDDVHPTNVVDAFSARGAA